MSAPTPSAPVVSTDLIGSLDAVIPIGTNDAGMTSAGRVAWEARRVRQVLLTALPLAAMDLFILAAIFIYSVAAVAWVTGWSASVGSHMHLGALAFCYMLIGSLFQLFPGTAMSPVNEVRQQVISISLSYLVLLVLNGVFGKIITVEVATFSLGLVFSVLAMPLARHLTRHFCSSFSWWGEPVVIVGATRQGRSIYRFLKKTQQRGLRPVGLIDSPHRLAAGIDDEVDPPYLGPIDELRNLARAHNAYWAIAAIADAEPQEAREILGHCSVMPNLIVFPTQVLLPSLWAECRECGGQAGILIRDHLLLFWPKLIKRAFDIVMALALMVLTVPFLPFVALLIKVLSPGPVFYGHPRVGENGRHFRMWKFRSMVPGADQALANYLAEHPELQAEWEVSEKLRHDPRVIPLIGLFLRNTSLDEIPQLWNVLIGDMSIVGPRPVPVCEAERYDDCFELYLKVRPGVTGLWQISGRCLVNHQDRMRLNTYYCRNWSLWLDYYIILRTVRTILLREGAY